MKILLGLSLASLLLTSCGKQTDYRGQNGNTNTLKPEDRPLRLTQFEQIHGTHYLMAEIAEVQSRASSSYSENGKTRNLVFLDGESLASHRLFDTSAYIILATIQYPTHDKEGDTAPATDGVVTQWLVYQVLKSDTNGDGRLDAIEMDQRAGIRERQRPQKDRVHDGEDRCRRAHPERERQHRDGRVAGVPTDEPKREPEILEQAGHEALDGS